MKDQRTHLKIKIKNLADESRTIRAEERKTHGMAKWNLQHHRKTIVRDAARSTLIAYQHIRGRDPSNNFSGDFYKRLADFKAASRMINKYGSSEAIARIESLESALKYTRISKVA